jgi:Flp pilus assembly pilin Flp
MKRRLPYLIHDEGGQDLAEYALLLGFIAMLMAITLISFGVSVNLRFSDASGQLGGVAAGGGQAGAGSGGAGGSPPGSGGASAGGGGGGAGDSVSGGGTGDSGSGGGSSGRPADDNRNSERFEQPTP